VGRTELSLRAALAGSGHERIELARQPLAHLLHLGHLTLQGAQHRPHIGPDRLRGSTPTRSATRRTNSSASNGCQGLRTDTAPAASAAGERSRALLLAHAALTTSTAPVRVGIARCSGLGWR
jgi:hypothetical protein